MKWYRIKALLLNYYYITLSSADRLFDIFYWPILDVLIQGISEFNIINSIMGGIVLWIFMWRASQDLVVYLLENYWSRSIYHMFISPIKKSELVISLCILGIGRSLVSFIVLNVVGFLLYKFSVFQFGYEFFLFVGLLFIMGWAVGLLISSLVLKFGTRVQVLAWSVIWIIQPFSCVFYPLSALPAWAAAIAKVNPLTHIFEGMRTMMAGKEVVISSLGYSLIVSIGLLLVAAWIFVQAMNSAKKQGNFAKPE